MTTIPKVRQEVQRQVERLFRLVDGGEAARIAEVEQGVLDGVTAVARELMTMFLTRQSSLLSAARYEHEGVAYEVVGEEMVEVGLRCGKVTFPSKIGRQIGRPRAPRDRPVERQIGLSCGFTPAVIAATSRLCAHMAFGQARTLHGDFFGWAPSSRAVLRIVDATGAEARPFLEAAPPPENDGEVLVIQVDGKGAPAITSREYAKRTKPHTRKRSAGKQRRHERKAKRASQPKKRRAPGDKSKNAKMAAVGVLYTLRRGDDGKLDGPVNKRVYATFTTYRALFEWIVEEAKKRGYGTSKFTKVLFVADGAEVLWTLQQEFFPDALVCLDWFHVVEKLWEVGKAVCRGTRRKRKELEAWVAKQKARLRAGEIYAILEELAQRLDATPLTGPGNKYRRTVLAKITSHLEKNIDRLHYDRLRKQDLDIGSGAVEGAVRHLVGARLDASGMRWGKGRAEAVLQLRCVLINGLWNDFEAHLARKVGFRVKGSPARAQTHDAVTKKAA